MIPTAPSHTRQTRPALALALSLAGVLCASPVPATAQPAPAAPGVAPGGAPAPLDAAGMKSLLSRVDERQRSSGDYRARAYIETKERNKADIVYDAEFYRRDDDDKFMILFLAPRTEAGKGYLRIDRNLWMYDPTVGKWERRTERERIGGTDSRRTDFDPQDLATDYTHEYIGTEQLGRFSVHHLKLTAKKGTDAPFPVSELWIDVETDNILKAQERALSGRLMRTVYYPKWEKLYSESKGAEVWYPHEIRIFDEVEKGNRTTVVMKSVDLKSLPANIFTKAWLESKSR